MNPDRLSDFAREYSDKRFVKKLKHYSRTAGYEVLDKAFRLYFVLQKPDTPKWVKGTIIGALGYFIFPLDALNDLLPLVGYSDDLSVLVAALATVSTYVDDDVKQKAQASAERWMGKALDPHLQDDADIIDEKVEAPGPDEV